MAIAQSSFKAQDFKVKIYSDGADKASMIEMAANPLIKGLTTNPTLMRKAGLTDYRSFAKDILSSIEDKPISFEVFADEISEMRRQALDIAAWGSNVYVKIPVTNSEGVSTAELIHELSQKGVQLNITAILTLQQTLTTCEALKGGAPAVVSIFAGRIADTGRDPQPVMKAARAMCEAAGPKVELLWASTREAFNICQADESGCHIVTVPVDILKKLPMFGKDLTQLSLETVRMFKTDAEAAGYKL